MENKKHNENNAGPVTGIAAVEGAESNAFANFISHDSNVNDQNEITDSPAERREKQIEYYDNKENPGRKFNINDQAYSQSSREDFVNTVSQFKHTDNQDPEGKSSQINE